MLSVVILNYNTCDITLKCLDCLHKSQGIEFETILVDNNSSDKSVELIKKWFPQVKLIENPTNVGFAIGNNQGMKQAKGEYILLLNSDCFVYPDTLAKSYAQADVLGCQLLNEDLTIQPSFGFFPSLGRVFMLMTFLDNMPLIRQSFNSIQVRDTNRYQLRQSVDWVTGAFVMLKKEIFTKTGGLDEKYFMYGEEVEWMYRIKKLGYQVDYFPDAQAIHIGRASTKANSVALLSAMKGYLYWYSKHNSKLQKFVLSLLLVFGCAIRIPAWAVWGKWDLVQDYAKILPKLIKATLSSSEK